MAAPAAEAIATQLASLPLWQAALAEFAATQRMQGHSERTVGNYAAMLIRVMRDTGRELDEITRSDLRANLSRPIAQSSRQVHRACFQVFFRFAKNAGFITVDAAEHLEKIKVQHRPPRPFTVDQVQQLLDGGAYTKTRTMILLGSLQGMRASEIARTRGEDFDMAENVIRYVAKGGIQMENPMHPLIRDEAWRYPRRGFWFPTLENNKGKNDSGHILGRSVSDNMSERIKAAGLDGGRLTGHSLRHYFATQLLDAQVDLRTIQVVLGHRSLATTAQYLRVSPSQAAAAIAKLPTLEVPAHAPRRRQETA